MYIVFTELTILVFVPVKKKEKEKKTEVLYEGSCRMHFEYFTKSGKIFSLGFPTVVCKTNE